MTASSSLEVGRAPVAHAAADLTRTPWKSTTLTPTPGAPLRSCQTSAQTWPPSRTEARYTLSEAARLHSAIPPLQTKRSSPNPHRPGLESRTARPARHCDNSLPRERSCFLSRLFLHSLSRFMKRGREVLSLVERAA